MKELSICGVLITSLVFTGCTRHEAPSTAPVQPSVAEVGEAFDGTARFAELEGSDDGQAWLVLSRSAREAGDLDTAQKALEKAAATGFSPPSVNFEKVRLAIAMDRPDAAEDIIEAMIGNGFAAVQFLANDPVVSTLKGRERFDAMVEELSVAAYPCEHQEGFNDFDFWLGEWIVHTAAGQHAGNNVIRSTERSCVITEHWTDVAGGTGMSVNYLDKATNEWVQVWNASSGSQINIRGDLTDDGMAMSGTIYYVSSGTGTPFRALWTPLEDGRVRQYFEHSTDGGETWTPWFEGFYTRIDIDE